MNHLIKQLTGLGLGKVMQTYLAPSTLKTHKIEKGTLALELKVRLGIAIIRRKVNNALRAAQLQTWERMEGVAQKDCM